MLITALDPATGPADGTHAAMLAYLPDPQRPPETLSWLWPGDQTHPNVASRPQVQQQTVGQEQSTGAPAHPPPVTLDGVATHQNVAIQIQQRTVAQEQPPLLPVPQVWPGDQTHRNVAAPPQVQQRTIGQEPPLHPPPPMAAGRQRPNVASPPQVRSVALVAQEPPWHPDPREPRLRIGYDLYRPTFGAPPPNVAAPPQIQKWIARQEPTPSPGFFDPAPFVRTSRMAQTSLPGQFGAFSSSNIVPPGIILAREQPPDPSVEWRFSISQASIGSCIAGAFVEQDLIWHPGPQTAAGVGAQSSVIERRAAAMAQESPYHPLPLVRVGLVPSNIPAGQRATATTQEQPACPLPQSQPGVAGPNVAPPPQIQSARANQEQPGHPLPATAAGPQQQQNVASPAAQVATIGVVRADPWHPAPLAAPRLTPANAHAPSQMARAVSAQEPPWHPLPSAAAGVQGPNVRTLGGDFAAVMQEQPWQPAPQTLSGIVQTRRGIGDFALIAQEQPPMLPTPLAKQWAPGFRIAARDWATAGQEQPFHPLPSAGASPQTQNVIHPAGTPASAVVGQEQPSQSPNSVQIGVQGPNVLPPVSEIVIVLRAEPWHPLPSVGASLQTQNIAVGIGRGWTTAQELPWHPNAAPRQLILPSTPTFAPPGRRSVTLGQELPWHPMPQTGMACTVFSPAPPGLQGLDLVAPERLLASPGRVRILSEFQGP